MNLQWTGIESVPTRTTKNAPIARPRQASRVRDEMDRAVERMLADARGKCGVARGGRWTRDTVPGRDASGNSSFDPGRAGVHTDVRHRRPSLRAG